MSRDTNKVHNTVAKDYANAVNKKTKCCCKKPAPKGVVAKLSEKAYIDGLKKTGLTNIKIRDRLIYDVEQLKAFIGSELHNESACRCKQGELQQWAEQLLGKVWSVKVYAQKK